jgi:hypothetical protein
MGKSEVSSCLLPLLGYYGKMLVLTWKYQLP